MKRISCLVFSIALLLLLSACSSVAIDPPVGQQPAEYTPAIEQAQPANTEVRPLEADLKGVYVLRQEDFIYVSEGEPHLSPELEKVDGEQIVIIGFMASFSPEGKDYFYLVRTPDVTCSCCVVSDWADLVILTVFMEDGTALERVEEPIAVTGTLSMEEIEDDSGMINYLNVVKAEIRRLGN